MLMVRSRARDRDLGACGFLRDGFQGQGCKGHGKQKGKELRTWSLMSSLSLILW